MALKNKELQSIQISEGIVHLGECNNCITLRLNPISANLADLATGQERQLTKGKRTERTKHDFWCPIYRSVIVFPVLRSMRELIRGQQRN